MRLLFITNVFPNPLEPTKGVFNLQLARALSDAHEVGVVCPVAWTDECAALCRGKTLAGQRCRFVDGIRVRHPRFYFPPKVLREHYGRFMWHSVKAAVQEELEQLKPDAIMSYWAHPDGEVAVRAARQSNVPSLVMVGGSDVLLLTGSPRRRERILNVLNSADAVVPVSHHIRERLIEFGIAPSKIHVVERGVDTSVFCPGDRDEARHRLGIATEQHVLLWVGRMVPVKGLDVLIRGCGELRRLGRQVHLYLVGDGPLRGSIASQARAQGVSDLVHFVGVVDHRNLADWYRAADVTVLSSRSEGVPNVLRESLACGTPFVATDVGGIAELGGGALSRLVSPENSRALADAIEEVITGSAARQSVCSQTLSWRASAEVLVRVLRSLADQPSRSDGTPITGPTEDACQLA